MKVAVVGSGLAGLHAAWLLASPEHYDDPSKVPDEVHLFERNESVGMDAASVDVDDGRTRVDIPMRGFYRGYYPLLTRLYDLLHIEYGPRDHTVCFAGGRGEDDGLLMNGHVHNGADRVNQKEPSFSPIFVYENYTIAGVSVPLPSLKHGFVNQLRIGVEWLRFLYASHQYVGKRARGESTASVDRLTLGQFLDAHKYSTEFRHGCILPFMAGICTCFFDDMEAYPAATVLEFCGSGMAFEGANVVMQGVRQVCQVLSASVKEIHLSTPVTAIYDTPDAGRPRLTVQTAAGDKHEFDHVVIASQANQALRMLQDATPAETAALGAFTYVRSEVVLHGDERVMPESKDDWRGINFATVYKPSETVPSATNYMNAILPSLAGAPNVFQTWNPPFVLDNEKIISRSVFERPLVTLDTKENLERFWAMQGQRNIWFVGAYADEGVPLLEGCVSSGSRVAAHFGVKEERVYAPRKNDLGQKVVAQKEPNWRTSIIVPVVGFFLNLFASLLGWNI